MKYTVHLFSPSNIKHQIGVAQTMSIPELIVGFFKAIFYAFYYSGYGVWQIIRYLLIDVLMSLMRGPAEEVIEEVPVEEDRFRMRALPALPSEDTSSDTNKEDNGQSRMAPHDSTQPSLTASDETGENTSEEGTGEQTEMGEVEQPLTLVRMSNYTQIYRSKNGF